MDNCQQHPGQEIMFLCEDCMGKLLCAFCLTEFHKGHNFEHINNATPKRTEQLQRTLNNLEDHCLPSLRQKMEYTDRQMECNDTEHKIQFRKIKRTGNNLKLEIDILTASMISLCEQMQKENNMALEYHKQTLQRELERVSSFIEEGKHILRYGNRTEICTISDSGFHSDDILPVSDLKIINFQLSESLQENLKKAFGHLVSAALDVDRYDEIVSNKHAGGKMAEMPQPEDDILAQDREKPLSTPPQKQLKSILVNKWGKMAPSTYEGEVVATPVEITPEGLRYLKDSNKTSNMPSHNCYPKDSTTQYDELSEKYWNEIAKNSEIVTRNEGNVSYVQHPQSHCSDSQLNKESTQGNQPYLYPKLPALDEYAANPAVPRVREPVSPPVINAISPKLTYNSAVPEKLDDGIFVWPKSQPQHATENNSKGDNPMAAKYGTSYKNAPNHWFGQESYLKDPGRIRASSTPTHEDEDEDIAGGRAALPRATNGTLEISNVTNVTNFHPMNYTVSETDRKSTTTEQEVQTCSEEMFAYAHRGEKSGSSNAAKVSAHHPYETEAKSARNMQEVLPIQKTSCAVQTSIVMDRKLVCDKETMVYYGKSLKLKTNQEKNTNKSRGKIDKSTTMHEDNGTSKPEESQQTHDKAIGTDAQSLNLPDKADTHASNLTSSTNMKSPATTSKPSVTIAPFAAKVCFTDEKILPNNKTHNYGQPPDFPYKRAAKINWSPPTKFRE